MKRALALATVAVAALVVSGCKGSCRQLSEKLCDCSTNTTARTNCLTLASAKDNVALATDEDNARCEALIATCDCRLIDTQQGKEACGLARPAP